MVGRLKIHFLVVMLIAAATVMSTAAYVSASARSCAGDSPGCQLFAGRASLLQQNPKPFTGNMHGHGETTTVRWNGRWLMYYRTFIRADGEGSCSFPTGIAMATSSDDGSTWQEANAGRPLPTLQSVMPGGCAEDTAITATELYAPDVIVDGSHLLMVFERRDTDAAGVECAAGRACISIGYATSTASGGDTWSTQHRLLKQGTVGAWDDEVGTPDIELYGSPRYVLTFHGHDATNRLRPYYQRGLVTFGALRDDVPGRAKVSLSLPGWASQGIGLSDMHRESDGYWYIVFEAFSGTDYRCGQPGAETAVGIARSADVRSWTIRGRPLLRGGLDGLSCGWDVPNFQLTSNRAYVVTNDDSPAEAVFLRWAIQVDPPAARWTNGGTVLSRNTYLGPGDQLSSGTYRLVMQADGNLVLYGGTSIWATNTARRCPDPRATMQVDGNFVLSCRGTAAQATASDGHPGAVLSLHPDGVWVLTAESHDFYAKDSSSAHGLAGGCFQQC